MKSKLYILKLEDTGFMLYGPFDTERNRNEWRRHQWVTYSVNIGPGVTLRDISLTDAQINSPVTVIATQRNEDTTTTFGRVKKLIVEHLGCNEHLVTPTAIFIDDLGADSLDGPELTMAIEDKFGIQILNEVAEQISTVQQAVDTVDRLIGNKK